MATHDNEIINQVKQFMKENHIGKDKMEFQMLYGFRTELAQKIANEGYFLQFMYHTVMIGLRTL